MYKLISSIVLFLAGSFSANALTVVSDRSNFHLEFLLKEFSRQTGIDVSTAFVQKGTLYTRVSSEVDDADVIIATSITSLVRLKQGGYTQTMEKCGPVAADDDCHYTALSYRARTIVYSRDRVNVKSLSSYNDLADPRFKGRVCMRPLTHPYNVALVASMIEDVGTERAGTWVKGVRSNLAVRPSGNDRAQAAKIAEGVCDISLMNTYYYGLMLSNNVQREQASKVQLFFPNQTGNGTYVMYSGASVAASSRQVEEANKLVQFLLSPMAQAFISGRTFEYPVVGLDWDLMLQALGEDQLDGSKAKLWTVNPAKTARNYTEALRLLNN
jgi:iron(III) transport system substrate-binding protein